MKLVNILQSQAARFFTASSLGGGPLYGGNLAKAFEARYGFLQGPRTIDEYDARKGIVFLHGFFEGRSVIDKLRVFEIGAIVDARVPTEECDLFLDDAIRWARQEAGVAIEEGRIPGFYQSGLEVRADFSLELLFNNQFVSFCQQIIETLKSYGETPPGYFGISGITFQGVSENKPQSDIFRFERRTEQPYDSHLYYTTAPLRTSDHLRLLDELEKALLA